MIRLLVALLLAASAQNAHSETFTVTRLNDPSPDGCLPGDCSFREALEAAAANSASGEPDVILVPAGVIQVRVNGGPLPDVVQPLRVQGAGSAQTFIKLPGTGPLFQVREGGELLLRGMEFDVPWQSELMGGSVSVSAHASAYVRLEDISILEGSVVLQAGASGHIVQSRLHDPLRCFDCTDLLVEDSVIANIGLSGPTSQTTLRRVTLDNSLDPEPSPGLAGNVFIRTGNLTIEDSTITRSSFYIEKAEANLNLRRVHYIDNAGPIRTEAAATVTIENSLFENNTVRALYAAGGANWNVSGSSFVNNSANGNAGGAVVLEDNTTLRIDNSTFSGNTFPVEAASDGARGAAIGYRNGTGANLILRHVTVVSPMFMPAGIVGSAIGGHGGGVTLTLSNSILRGTCGMNADVLSNNAGNIESSGNTCGLEPEQNRINVSAANLALGPLGDNDGPTPTHLPGPGSFAIDRASTPQCLPLDQRGYFRPGGARCDIGAVESDGTPGPEVFADGFE